MAETEKAKGSTHPTSNPVRLTQSAVGGASLTSLLLLSSRSQKEPLIM